MILEIKEDNAFPGPLFLKPLGALFLLDRVAVKLSPAGLIISLLLFIIIH